MWLFDLFGIRGSEPKPRRKRNERTHADIILDAMLANQGIKTLWRMADFQHGEYFVGYKANVAITKLRREGLIENGPKDGRFQTYRLTQKGSEYPLSCTIMAPDETVAEEVRGTLQDTLEQLRSEIKAVGSTVKFTSDAIKGRDPNIEGEDKGEMIANTILAYRHLEDAAMRLGKALQAMNGGVSIFDKK